MMDFNFHLLWKMCLFILVVFLHLYPDSHPVFFCILSLAMSPARWRLELGPQNNLGAVLIYCGAGVKQPPPSSALSTTLENFMPLKHPPETESSGALEWLTTHFLGLLPEYCAFIHSNSCFLSTQTKHRIPFLEIIFFHYFLLAH